MHWRGIGRCSETGPRVVELYERDISSAIRLALGRMPDVVLWRNSAGITTYQGRVARFGLAPGAADLVGILTVDGLGVFLSIEVKRPSGRVGQYQRQWGDLVIRRGGVYLVCHSAEEALDGVEKARESIRFHMRRTYETTL